MMDVKKSVDRNQFIDVLKGLAIILVLIGHALQHGSGSDYFESNLCFDNMLFKIIYSFHMPLFMVVSGYLFNKSMHKYSMGKLITTRVKSLLIPILAWAFITSMISLIENGYEYNGLSMLKNYIITATNTLWFLWAVFLCSMVVIFVGKLFRDNYYIYFTGLLITFFIPDIYGLEKYKYMYPFFLLAYLYSENEEKIKCWLLERKRMSTLFLVISGIIYVILLSLYNRDTYIYTSGYALIRYGIFNQKQLVIDIHRFVIGFTGVICIIYFMKRLFDETNNFLWKGIGIIGKESLGIYILSEYIFTYLVSRILSGLNGVNYGIVLLESVVILLVSYFATKVLKKNGAVRAILFGGRK